MKLEISFLFALFVISQVYCQSTSSPVFVTPYLPGNYQAAQNATKVTLEGYPYDSYAGYFTVNATYNSNTFFWYFPAHFNPADAPVLVWLQGGPGSSSMFGLFNENGPFFVSTENFPQLVANNYTWVANFSMIYIDNPVGAGFSFTDSDRGYSTNEDEVGDNLYNAITQFFQLFPELKENDFYITGESYAGKYVPSAAYKIYNMNQNPNNQYVNLKGISIGDGMMDPLIQTQGYADLMFQLSLMDENEVVQGYIYENLIEKYILQQNYSAAFFVFDEYLNADFYPYDSYYFNVTGLTSYYNFLTPTYHSNPYIEFLNLPSTKQSIHVGTNPYHDYNSTCETYLIPDWMKSIAYKMPDLLNNYKVLVYNGQNDVILSGPVCENFLRTIQWDGQNQYLSADKIIWKVEESDQQVAGYVRQALNFRQVLVRDAGHILPADQPRAAFDMIYRFIYDISFAQN